MDSQLTRDKLLHDFNIVITETEELLKTVGAAGGEKSHELRMSVEKNLKAARDRLQDLEDSALHRARVAARTTDRYVHGHPWQSIGVAAGIAGVAGVVVGLLLNRR